MSERHSVKMNLPCTLRYLNLGPELVTAMLTRLPEPPDERTVASIQLSVQEVCANIAEHANDDEACRFDIIVSLDEAEDKLVIETYDGGSSFNPQAVAAPVLGVEQVGGYGLFLIKKAMDEVRYFARTGQCWESVANSDWRLIDHRTSDKNYWRLVKYLA